MGAHVDTEWLAGRYGLMVHYLLPKVYGPDNEYSEDINELADHFDLDGFMADFDASGADWLIFTIGQNTGFYSSPNSVLDSYAGAGHATRRDLVYEIAQAVKRRGKRFIAYLPCEVNSNLSLQTLSNRLGSTEELRQAILLSTILGPPKGILSYKDQDSLRY